eukprot:213734-Pyramimonas_sp.AAC.1
MHHISEVREDFLDRRWTPPLPGARSSQGAALEASPGGPNADSRNPRGPPIKYVYDRAAAADPATNHALRADSVSLLSAGRKASKGSD